MKKHAGLRKSGDKAYIIFCLPADGGPGRQKTIYEGNTPAPLGRNDYIAARRSRLWMAS